MNDSEGRRTAPQAEPATTRPKKERVTFQLPVELIEKARDAVYWTPGLTMGSLMEGALVAHLDRVEKKRGLPFASRAGAAVRTGRPVKAV